jgi:hypothetical protein
VLALDKCVRALNLLASWALSGIVKNGRIVSGVATWAKNLQIAKNQAEPNL